MSTFETLARDLATRFDLGNQATPFLRMLMAHMTNPDKGGLPGFVQSLRSAGWNTLESWLGRADLATNATEEHIERAFGHNGGLIGNITGKLGLGRDTIVRAIAFAVPALLGRLTPGGTVPTVLPPEATTYIGDRREWIVSATAVTAAPVAAARSSMGWLPWVIAALVAALLLGWRLDDMPALKVYFDSGSTTIAPEFNDKAKHLADYLAANSGAKAAISGFNDPTGDPVKNAELSKNRAQAVQAALVSAGVAADSLELRKPADTTCTAATNAASSRVEVTLFK